MSAETVLSVLFGGLITLVVSWGFYKRAGDQLRDESRELRIRAERVQQAVNVLGRAMEERGWARITRDESGTMTGLVILLEGAASGSSAASGELTVALPRPRGEATGE